MGLTICLDAIRPPEREPVRANGCTTMDSMFRFNGAMYMHTSVHTYVHMYIHTHAHAHAYTIVLDECLRSEGTTS